ncbi:hypothetical protein EPYR_01193 [Erwinia pyrifoliae DSM 12163]|nr:hypothetical protein EPYR_01193 [Erwinia pyrifoliae DSM 12163]
MKLMAGIYSMDNKAYGQLSDKMAILVSEPNIIALSGDGTAPASP